MLLAEDDSFSSCVYVKEGSEILGNEKIDALLINMMDRKASVKLKAAEKDGSSYLVINDTAGGNLAEAADDRLQTEISFGEITYSGIGKHPCLYINDPKTNLLKGDWNLTDSTTTEPDMQIWVIDNRTGEIAYSSKWDYAVTEESVLRQ